MKIELARSEIDQFVSQAGSAVLPPWEEMNPSERRQLAATILRSRVDAQSQEYAFLIETNNPNFNTFVVVENA